MLQVPEPTLDAPSLDRVVAGTGPGSYNGIRAALAGGWGIAQARGIPFVGICSLLGLAEGEAKYDGHEALLSQAPVIGVPTITMEGDANGAPHPDPSAYAKMFSGKYSHRTIKGGVGHNLPQEAPKAFAAAIMDVTADV